MLGLVNAVKLVAWAHLAWYLERYPVALAYGLNSLKVHAWILKVKVYRTGGGACNQNLVTGLYLSGLNEELAYAKVLEVLDGLANVHLALCGL